MLNARLYRTCWLVAGVALVVALLTLESPDRGPTPAIPVAIEGEETLEISEYLAGVAPERPAGSEADLAAARIVQNQLAQLPGMGGDVQVQEFEARSPDGTLQLQNVFAAVPGESGGGVRGGVVVVAPRDTPRGVSSGASATAVMLRLARQSVTTRHLRPHLFVSTDGNTVGQAGMRWFLERFSSFPISSVMVLDGIGDVEGDRIHVWVRGTDSSHALQLARAAEGSIARAGGRAEAVPGLGSQVMRLAVPQTFGDQGPAVAADIPAVTLAGRPDSPLVEGAAPTAERLELAANAASDLLAVLDQPEAVSAPDAAVALAGRVVRPSVARLALLLLALPVLVLAVDAVAGLRRGRSLAAGARAALARAPLVLSVLAAAHLFTLIGLWPGTAAGNPPLPSDASFGWSALFGLALLAGLAVAWRRLPRRGRARPEPESPAPAALLVLSVLLVVLWLVNPFALLLALPAAHALLLAQAAERVWQVRVLAAIGALPLLVLTTVMASTLDSNPVFAAWYLLQTTASGARGAVGPLLGAVILAVLWSLASTAGEHARRIANPDGVRRRRPRLSLRIERVPVGHRRRAARRRADPGA